MTVKTPNYVLTRDFAVKIYGTMDRKVLPAGSFVKPIDPMWVPQHVKDHDWIFPAREMYAYTHYGIVVVPIDAVREV